MQLVNINTHIVNRIKWDVESIMTLGVFHQVYTRPKATEEAIKSFRQFHPDTPYVLICDGGKSFHRIAKRYDCLYVHEEDNLGYRDHTHASGIYGMTKEEVLEWLRRFSIGLHSL